MGAQDDSMRVCDAEREATLKTLGDHAAVGRLSLDELEERAAQALTVRTRGELAALTSDLPTDTASAPAQATAVAQVHQLVRRTIAVMGGTSRRGPFRAVGTLSATAVMGGEHVDLIRVRGFNLMGGTTVFLVPPHARALELAQARHLSVVAGHYPNHPDHPGNQVTG